ncbi:carboxylesterase [Histoplasma capsulatum H143]|uniref:Carboxylic ester hydrolase n=1 Tax=Ajellomyces capsulatus (strain H143) TaxID=544712 RepID=C6HD96_AJECH|nr:carboxylesterase [Histoplasma capsulatum H143]
MPLIKRAIWLISVPIIFLLALLALRLSVLNTYLDVEDLCYRWFPFISWQVILPSWARVAVVLGGTETPAVTLRQGTVVGKRFSPPVPVHASNDAIDATSYGKRLGAFGFLSSKVAAKGNALNVGLRDQNLLLKWVHENIEAFGGNPNDVALFGLSAGAHSIGHHVMHYEEGMPSLFRRVIMESGAATSRAVYPYNHNLHELQFKEFLVEAGCSGLEEDGIMSCLRSKPALTIALASSKIFSRYESSDRWAFQPVIDGDIIKQAPIKAWEAGNWNKVSILTGFNTNEGTSFVPSEIHA